jgi:hypothetical protein
MATRTFAATKSSLFADGPSNLGGGADDHMPIGSWSGYTFRSAVQFATDWSGMVRITKAVLHLTTTTQVHLGFSSAPDVVVRRATASWSANGGQSSADSGGGGGWSTSPTTYPGPSASDTGKVTKRCPTSQSTGFDVDITAIVRAWAPASVEGGGGSSNYGVRLDASSASSDQSEFYSYRASSNKPTIVVTYETDTAPVTTADALGVVTTVLPTLTASAIDADGDPVTAFDFEVRKAGALHYASGPTLPTTAGPPMAFGSHKVTANLSSGPLTLRARAQANGVYGAWSADVAFTVDRPPSVVAFSAPPASVTGTRRPPITFTATDADGDAIDLYDVEVYQDAGGGVAGPSTYKRASQNATITPGSPNSTVTHTPQADLPGGAQLVRVRVHSTPVSGPAVWSSWSAYRAFTVVTTTPVLTWTFPDSDGGWSPYRDNEMTDWAPVTTLPHIAVRAFQVRYAPQSGTTITSLLNRVEVIDSGVGGPAVGTLISNANISGIVPAGSVYEFAFRPDVFAPAWYAGTLLVTLTLTAANASQTVETRRVRFAAGEYLGAIALGDSVTSLATVETPKLDACFMAYRAQTNPSTPNGAALWRPRSQLATVQAELPATNAYLGLRLRMYRQADDGPINADPGFEDASMANWAVRGVLGAGSGSIPWSTAPEGLRVLRVNVGTGGYMGYYQRFGVIQNAWYAVSGWIARPTAAGTFGSILVLFRDATGAQTGTNLILTGTTTSYGQVAGSMQAPAGATQVEVQCVLQNAAPVAGSSVLFDDVRLYGMLPGDAGFDWLDVTWSSLG